MFWESKDGKQANRIALIKEAIHYSVRRTAHALEEARVVAKEIKRLEGSEKKTALNHLALLAGYVADTQGGINRIITALKEEEVLTEDIKKQVQRIGELTKELEKEVGTEVSAVEGKQIMHVIVNMLRLEKEIAKE
ncbi:hypothetical protein HQ545_01205 [Candidatus Woesearchaeota archaeon]|nr:hypothetical protein [Candidatus Woesearchaeota archaeon]